MKHVVSHDQNIVTALETEKGHKAELSDMKLAMEIANKLNQHYPGHLWAVHINSEQGYATIKNFRISTKYGMFIKLSTIYADRSLKKVVRFAGELLERAEMKRGKSNMELAKVLQGAPQKHQPREGIII